MRVCYIYKITNSINNKIYIGFTNRNPEQRKAEHFSPSQYKNRKTKLYFAIHKYGKEKFIFETIYCSLNQEHCLKMETYFIGLYNSIENGYNLTIGGDCPKMTGEIRKKISDRKKGHKVTKETRKKLSDKNNKNWKIIYSDGKEIKINNLKQFCEGNSVSYSHISKRKQCKKLNIIGMEMSY